MKIKIFIILLVCIISLQGTAQNNDSTLYSFLEFDNGIAVKNIVVDFKCIGKDPIATINTNDSLISAINKSIMLNSNTAMEFYYNSEHYYIGLHDRCSLKVRSLIDKKMKSNVDSIKIMITIAFFENVYYRGLPYAVVIDIKRKY
jgi:hypothetical protein